MARGLSAVHPKGEVDPDMNNIPFQQGMLGVCRSGPYFCVIRKPGAILGIARFTALLSTGNPLYSSK